MSNEIPQPGSIISLISNAQMRYEGTLELINMGPEESSLSLSNVKSFGTEDRVDPSRHVPPADDRFEFVVFKGTDIISLDVKEYYRGPPRQTPAPPPAAPPQRAPSYPPPQQASVWGPPSNAQPQGSTWGAPNPQQGPPQGPPQYAAQPQAPPAPAPPGQPTAAPAPTVVVTPSMVPRSQADVVQTVPRQSAWSNARSQQGGPKPAAPPQAAAGPPQADSAGPPPGFNGPPPGIQAPREPRPPQQPSSYASAAGGGQGAGQANGGRGRGGRGPRGGGRGRGPPPQAPRQNGPPRAPPIPVPSEDFNFEEALSRFDKDKLKEEADHTETQEEVPAVPQAYNKDDFFDVLSSDLQDRLNTSEPKRRPFSEQRKLDMETFGGSGVARRPGRGRGRGRGRGGPGRGRGRGRNQQEQPVAVA